MHQLQEAKPLNHKDAYTLPNLEEAFSALAGSKWFSVLDLKSGYYQIEMLESDKQKTAFVYPLGIHLGSGNLISISKAHGAVYGSDES